jgi:hypothetical protein
MRVTTFVVLEGIVMTETIRTTRRVRRQARIAVLAATLVLTGSVATAVAADLFPTAPQSPPAGGARVVAPQPDVVPVDATGDSGDMAPMIDPVEDVDDSADPVDAAFDDSTEDPGDTALDGDMAPMIDPVEDEDLS